MMAPQPKLPTGSMSRPRLSRLQVKDWRDYQLIRLEALRSDPQFFCPSQDETQFTEADWKNRLANPNAAVFGLFVGDSIVGLTAIIRVGNQASSTRAELVSSYIRKEFRGLGFSRLFYEARIAWARAQGDITTLVVEHHRSNIPSFRAHQKFSFKPVPTKHHPPQDGATLVFELEL